MWSRLNIQKNWCCIELKIKRGLNWASQPKNCSSFDVFFSYAIYSFFFIFQQDLSLSTGYKSTTHSQMNISHEELRIDTALIFSLFFLIFDLWRNPDKNSTFGIERFSHSEKFSLFFFNTFRNRYYYYSYGFDRGESKKVFGNKKKMNRITLGMLEKTFRATKK